jgi:hypothetical protein
VIISGCIGRGSQLSFTILFFYSFFKPFLKHTVGRLNFMDKITWGDCHEMMHGLNIQFDPVKQRVLILQGK